MKSHLKSPCIPWNSIQITIKFPSNLIKHTNISRFVGSHTPASPACPRQQHPSEMPRPGAQGRDPSAARARGRQGETSQGEAGAVSLQGLGILGETKGKRLGSISCEECRTSGIEVLGLFIDYRLTTNIGEKYTFCVFFSPGLSFKLFFIYIMYDCRDMRVD